MNIQTDISDTLTTSKAYAVTWDLAIIAAIKNGEDKCCDMEEILLYTIWIEMLQNYYNLTYGGVQYYGYRYLSESQALLLMARINSRDFRPQTQIEVTLSGDFNNDFNDDFLIS